MPVKGTGKGLVTAMSVKMRAEITAYENGTLRGELHSQYLETPYLFSSLVRMIGKMEEIFDTNRFPEKYMLPRSFGINKNKKNQNEENGSETVKDLDSPEKNEASGGSKCTFEISVRFRQNATWQGQIFWAEKNLTQNFRSVLEMLKLMDEALTDGEEKSVAWND